MKRLHQQKNKKMRSVWDLVTPELVTEILCRIPAKPLCSFKLVSKEWNGLISEPEFMIRPASSWVILNRIPVARESECAGAVEFELVEPPQISSGSINPYKLAADPCLDPSQTLSKYPPTMLLLADLALSKHPCTIINSSNGLLLVSLSINRDPHKAHQKDPDSFAWAFHEESFFVVNPVTLDFLPLSQPRLPLHKDVAFTTALHPVTLLVDNFFLAHYVSTYGSTSTRLSCFSSDLGKWVSKPTTSHLGPHSWRPHGSFDFQGRLFWFDLCAGLLTWDADPFLALHTPDPAVFRFIPIPDGRAKPSNTRGLRDSRCFHPGTAFIHYMEVSDSGFKLWSLTNSHTGHWDLIYNLSPNLFGKSMPTPRFVHPFHSHLVYFQNEDAIFSLNVRTGKVETRISATRDMSVLPMLLPNWPSPLPKALYAAYAKELGNECFKSCNFSQAIECYTKSIDLSPNAPSFANRAMSYLKVNKFQEAENDCTESLKLDANNFKVYWRRALARKELGDLEGALKDVEFGLKLEPQNNQFRNLCVELKSMLEKDTCAEREYGEKDAAGDV